LLTGILALTVWILLLLTWFLATALLLTRLLPRVLVLLARILVLIRHCDLPFSKSPPDNPETQIWFRENFGSTSVYRLPHGLRSRGFSPRLENYPCTSA
jgi:hypothetical protein